MIRQLLVHPLARDLDLDDPQTTVVRRRILQSKGFLRQIYHEWYRRALTALPQTNGPVLELGSGAGFLRDSFPELITSDILQVKGLSVVLDANEIPFKRASLRAIVMIDVLHHLCRPRRFLREATRCVKPLGRLVMIEPWVTNWSRLVYSRLHHEPFDPESGEWEFPMKGPLSGANGALPWILFQRDRSQFAAEFPQWRVESIQPQMPISYLLSGGVSLRGFAPARAYGPVKRLEERLQPWMDKLAMFAQITLERLDLGNDEEGELQREQSR
ncbi:MAG: class I SAM-dependent methyltransferase [Desulfomonilaceae bacterium]